MCPHFFSSLSGYRVISNLVISQNKSFKTYLGLMLPPGSRNWKLLSHHYISKNQNIESFSVCACGVILTQTLELGMLRRVFYHCAIAAGHKKYKLIYQALCDNGLE